MDSGLWALGLIAIPFICLIVAIYLIIIRKKKNDKSKITLILIIILLMPMLNALINMSSNVIQKFSYANVKNIKYEIEKVNDWEFNIYFYDDKHYYRVKEQNFNLEYENEVFLLKSSTNKIVGLNINLLNTKTSKVYVKDYYGNKVLVWENEN